MNSYYVNVRQEIAKLLPKDLAQLKILEIGCGAGEFKINIDKCKEYWGIEPIEEVANKARDKIDKVMVGTYRELEGKLPDRYFDIIICNDVIEHMDDENWFLTDIKNKMKNDALIIGSIPNVRYISVLLKLIITKDWKYENSGILDKTHMRFFTKKSLIRTFQKNKYDIDRLIGINEIKIDVSSLLGGLKSVALILITYLFGRDSRYMQYGFRLKNIVSNLKQDD